MNKIVLEKQAWDLFLKLNRLYMAESLGHAVSYSTPNMRKKLNRVHRLANARFHRRQASLFNYLPGGFAPSPVKPSVVSWQGASL